jgi:hypothetical protein
MIQLIVIALSMVVNPSTAQHMATHMHTTQAPNGDYTVRYSNAGTVKHTPARWEQPQRFYSDEGLGAPSIIAKHL